ncbi:MAG: carboxypeptidase-like regulatory domain-containing protein [Bacteroidetes bacterium]|nr:carboxypeptidase-like regulatory domain-containing protein [Bacteroidota bacterium]
MRWILFIIGAFFLSLICDAQKILVKGRVSDKGSSQPLPFATIYLNNTTIGSSSDENGYFELLFSSIPKFDLIVTYLGYNPQHFYFSVKSDSTLVLDILLTPKDTLLPEAIFSPDSSDRKRNYKEFKNLILGGFKDTDVRILNPRDIYIYFDQVENSLFALSRNPIRIENKVLGYYIEYNLENFKASYRTDKLIFRGSVFFREMKPSNNKQRSKWKRARLKVYWGSLNHLIKCILNNKLIEEGYEAHIVYPQIRPPDNLINKKLHATNDSIKYYQNLKKLPANSNIESLILHGKELLCDSSKNVICNKGTLSIKYYGKNYNPKHYQQSFVKILTDSLVVYSNGYFDRFFIYTEGYLGSLSKIGMLLPIDYNPNE